MFGRIYVVVGGCRDMEEESYLMGEMELKLAEA
jgi:hypothetical protein